MSDGLPTDVSPREAEVTGCWHYNYEMFCTQCDPASYGSCDATCAVNHEHCTCDGESCAVHPDSDEEDD